MIRLHAGALCLAVVLPVAVWTVALPGQTAEPALQLTWKAPRECPTGHEVEQAVLHLVGNVPGEPLDASVVVSKVGARYRAQIHTAGGARERSLEGESCEAIAEAVAVLLALAIDPTSLARADTQPLFAAPTVSAATAASSAPPPARTTPPAKRVRVDARLAGALESGPLPSTGVAGALQVGARLSRWSAHARVMVRTPQERDLPEPDGAGGRFGMVSAGLLACGAVPRPTSAWLDLCLAGEIGRLSGEGYGVSQPRSGSQVWLGLGGGALGVVALGSGLTLTGGLEVLPVPVHRPFDLDGIGEVYRPSGVCVRGLLGVGTIF